VVCACATRGRYWVERREGGRSTGANATHAIPPSFATPAVDGHYGDWTTPRALASAFRPAKLYSSADAAAVGDTLADAAAAGVGGLLVPCRAPTMARPRGGAPVSVPVREATNATVLGVVARAAVSKGLRVGLLAPPYRGRTARTVRDDVAFCLNVLRQAVAGDGALLNVRKTGDTTPPRPLVLVRAAGTIPCHHWRALLDPTSQFSVRNTAADFFGVAEWAKSTDGGLAECGFAGLATPPLDDHTDTDLVHWGAFPENIDTMRARAVANGLAFMATVAPGVDATPTRPDERDAVRSRDGGKRYVTSWRQAAHSAPDAILIDSWNGWRDGTQVEAAAVGDDTSRGSATALPPHGSPATQAYDTDDGAPHDPRLYIKLTAREAARAARTRPYQLPARLRSQGAKLISWRGHGSDEDDDDDDVDAAT
jgi:Glycosyl hydrolase family 99